MRIGVNSRIYQGSKTGIPYYVGSLYASCIKLYPPNEYIFFQTNSYKTIGRTIVAKTASGLLGNAIFDLFLVGRMAEKEKIEVFHGPANCLPFFKKKNCCYVVSVHDLAPIIVPQLSSKLYNLYYYHTVRWAVRNADMVISDSESTKRDIIKIYKIPENKIRVVYLGTNEVYLSDEVREPLVVGKYFLSVSTHPFRKNIISVVRAIALNRKLDDYRYVIVGNMDDRTKRDFELEVRRLGLTARIVVYGYASEEDLRNLYKYATALVYPSFYEGFGLPVIEAFASGCPVIASNISSIPEIVPDSQWLVDPYSISDIGERMVTMASISEAERAALINSNKEYVKRFNWAKAAEETLHIFKELIKNR